MLSILCLGDSVEKHLLNCEYLLLFAQFICAVPEKCAPVVYRIIDYSELKCTHKDHRVRLLALHNVLQSITVQQGFCDTKLTEIYFRDSQTMWRCW